MKKQKNTVRLPAITVKIPRMGMIVYVSPKIGEQENQWTAMFTAEIPMPSGVIEIQSFHLKCKSRKEAEETRDDMTKKLKENGSYPFIQHGF